MKERTVRPWSKRARELEAEHGPYADYAAWKEWFGSQRVGINDEDTGADVLEACEALTFSDLLLYCAFCDAADHYHRQPVAGRLTLIRWAVTRWLREHRPSRIYREWQAIRSGRMAVIPRRWWHPRPKGGA